LPRSWQWTRRVGIDLVLKDLATLSTGEKVEVPKFHRRSEERLATAQRARKTKRARAIHAKIASRRKDFLHKASAKLAKEYGFIFVGGVSPSKLAQTWMAKSVFDASWSRFKDMLAWNLRLRSGGMLLEVLEHHTTQNLLGVWPSALFEAERYRGSWNKRMDLRGLRNGPRPRRKRRKEHSPLWANSAC
jgi:transposase